MDFGGCRCQAFALTGDAANTDPVCTLSPHRHLIDEALHEHAGADAYVYRDRSSPASPAGVSASAGHRDRGARARLRQCPGARRADLEVPPGALVGLLGPNGAGKTTAMLLLATLLAPTRGEASIFGHDVAASAAPCGGGWGSCSRRPASTASSPSRRTSASPAAWPAWAGASPRRSRRGDRPCRTRGALAAQPARQLSGGWRRLLDIARASLHQPDLLILDEPTVGLDPEHRERIWSLLARERRERGTTILFSTHYLAEAEPSDRVVLLSRGRVVADGTPAALRATVGVEVAEIEGPGAERLVRALRGLGCGGHQHANRARLPRRPHRGSARRSSSWPAQRPGIKRFALRPATLEDVVLRAHPEPQRGTGRCAPERRVT